MHYHEQNPYDECLNTLEKWAVGSVCMGSAFDEGVDDTIVDICSEVVSVVVPVPVVGPQTAWTKAGAAAAAETAAVTAAAKGTAVNEAEALAKGSVDNLAPALARERAAFVSAYKERTFATAEQNASFIASVDNSAELALQNRTRVFDSENSVMKTLNDVTRDKLLVTSLTNRQKEILLKNLDELKAKYPGLKFEVYSDFKSVKIAIQNDAAFSQAMSDQLLADLTAMYAKTNTEFAAEMTRLGIVVPQAGDATKWMRAGYGRTVDEASLAARRTRTAEGSPQILDYNSPQVRAHMTARLGQIETLRGELAGSIRFRPLFEAAPNGVSLPRQEVFDFVRKNASDADLAQALRTRYGLTTFTADDAAKLRSYVAGVDEFSPTLLIGKRENVNLDQAANGGVSADFLGMGSANLQATAQGIAGQSDLFAALHSVREGERRVTAVFRQRMETFRRLVGGNVVCSGDDCVRTAAAALTNADKQNMLNTVARNADTRGIRMAFVAPDVPLNWRMQLAAQGESIEKTLRKELAGVVPANKLGAMTFGLDMQTVTLNEGTVNLIIGKSDLVRLSATEHAAIQQAFARALTKVNGNTSAYIQGTTQLREATLFFVPAGAVGAIPTGESE